MPKRAENDVFLTISIFFGILFLLLLVPPESVFQSSEWDGVLTVKETDVHLEFEQGLYSCSNDILVTTGRTAVEFQVYNQTFVNGKCKEFNVKIDSRPGKAFDSVLMIPHGDFVKDFFFLLEPTYHIYYRERAEPPVQVKNESKGKINVITKFTWRLEESSYISQNIQFEFNETEKLIEGNPAEIVVNWKWKNESIKEDFMECVYRNKNKCMEKFGDKDYRFDRKTGMLTSEEFFLGKQINTRDFMSDLNHLFESGMPLNPVTEHVHARSFDASKDSGRFKIFLRKGWKSGETIEIGFATTTFTLTALENNTRIGDSTPDFQFRVEGDYDGYEAELFINTTGDTMEGYGSVLVLNATDSNITANQSLSDGAYRWYVNATNSSATSQSDIQYFTVDTTPPTFEGNFTSPPSSSHYEYGAKYIFNISWEEEMTNCILEFNGTNYTMTQSPKWRASSLNTSLTSTGGSSSPAFYDIHGDGLVDMIAGTSGGDFLGYTWYNDQWHQNSSIISGLPDMGSSSNPCMYDIEGNEYLDMLSGNSLGFTKGFTWDGSQWNGNSTINSSIIDVGIYSSPMIYNIGNNDRLDLIVGNGDGRAWGFTWNGSEWIQNATVNKSLPDFGSDLELSMFDIDGNGVTDMIAGNENGDLLSFTWNGSQWTGNTTLNRSLMRMGNNTAPYIYDIDDDGLTDMMVGNLDGYFHSFTYHQYEYYLEFNDLRAGNYTWKVYGNDSVGNINTTDTWNYQIKRAPTETNLTLNGSDSDYTFDQYVDANFTVTLNATPANYYLNLTTNISGWEEVNGTSPLYNLTTTSDINIFNITGYYLGEENYTESSETHFATVRDSVSPSVDITGPSNNSNVYRILIVNVTLNDSGGEGIDKDNVYCRFDGYSWNNMTNNTGLVFNASINTSAYSDGDYILRINGSDLAGNSNTSYYHVVTVDNVNAPEPEGAVESDDSSGGGGGGGSSEKKYENFTAGYDLNVEIVSGSRRHGKVWVRNTGKNTEINVTLSEEISPYLRIDKEYFELEENEMEWVNLVFDAPKKEPEKTIKGEITFVGKDVERSLDLVMRIVPPNFKVDVFVPPEFREVYPGDSILVNISLENLGIPEDLPLQFVYFVEDWEGNQFYKEEDTITVEYDYKITENITFPSNLSLGKYKLEADLSYYDMTSYDYENVTVVNRPLTFYLIPIHSELRNYVDIPFDWFLILLLLLLVFCLLVMIEALRIHRESKRKKQETGTGGQHLPNLWKRLEDLLYEEKIPDTGNRTYLFGETQKEKRIRRPVVALIFVFNILFILLALFYFNLVPIELETTGGLVYRSKDRFIIDGVVNYISYSSGNQDLEMLKQIPLELWVLVLALVLIALVFLILKLIDWVKKKLRHSIREKVDSGKEVVDVFLDLMDSHHSSSFVFGTSTRLALAVLLPLLISPAPLHHFSNFALALYQILPLLVLGVVSMLFYIQSSLRLYINLQEPFFQFRFWNFYTVGAGSTTTTSNLAGAPNPFRTCFSQNLWSLCSHRIPLG